jgi:hypothetical protein
MVHVKPADELGQELYSFLLDDCTWNIDETIGLRCLMMIWVVR